MSTAGQLLMIAHFAVNIIRSLVHTNLCVGMLICTPTYVLAC